MIAHIAVQDHFQIRMFERLGSFSFQSDNGQPSAAAVERVGIDSKRDTPAPFMFCYPAFIRLSLAKVKAPNDTKKVPFIVSLFTMMAQSR